LLYPEQTLLIISLIEEMDIILYASNTSYLLLMVTAALVVGDAADEDAHH
jgi:hypothetical protein